jgi:D-alanyl-lipoteichoic acid acyltransferase DltB (MBOAT superfamily)
MLFNSGQFFFFFIGFYLLYQLLLSNKTWQNRLLLSTSYIFYAGWDYRFLSLIILSTLVDYFVAQGIQQAYQKQRPKAAKQWLLLSVCTNLGVLGFFKYFNFFADSLNTLSMFLFDGPLSYSTLDIVLPVGISFYTFQTMSYTFDVYRKKQQPVQSLEDFALFVAFFPQLMAGPIERAKKLLPQLQKQRTITALQLRQGGWLILWGVFKKVFIADNLAPYTIWAFHLQGASSTLDIYLALFAFSIQLYCDFSGYTDMARGMAKLMGIELSRNFNLPFFATNPAEIWQRWHMTLSNWFRDYVYHYFRNSIKNKRWYPLAGIPTMTLIGLWHGAAWKYVVFGLLWGMTLFVYNMMKQPIFAFHKKYSQFKPVLTAISILFTFHLWLFYSPFFIAVDVSHGWHLWVNLLTNYTGRFYKESDLFSVFFYATPLILMQLAQYTSRDHNIHRTLPAGLRIMLYASMIILLWVQGSTYQNEFIYFQF